MILPYFCSHGQYFSECVSLCTLHSNFSFFFLNLFILHPNCRLSSLFSSHSLPPSPSSSPQSIPLPYSVRKGHASQGHQQSIIYQAVVRLCTSLCIQVGQGNPTCRIGSQEPIPKYQGPPCSHCQESHR